MTLLFMRRPGFRGDQEKIRSGATLNGRPIRAHLLHIGFQKTLCYTSFLI